MSKAPQYQQGQYQATPTMSANKYSTPSHMLQPTYAHSIPHPNSEYRCYEGMLSCFGCFIGTLGSIPGCCCCPNPYQIVPQGSVGMFTKFGKYYRSVDPGLYFVNICSDKLDNIDIKIQVETVPSQDIMTKDNVSVNIESVLYWHITDPYVATYRVNSVRRALIERTMTTLRQVTGTKTLQDAIENREAIATEIETLIGPVADSWGVKIQDILIKDLEFSRELKESLSAAAQQKRLGESKVIAAKAEGEAKIITAQAEVNAATLMREAADILSTSAAMQIRYLETMSAMAKAGNAKVIFMPPTEGLSFTPSDLKGKGKAVSHADRLAVYEQMAQQ